MRKTRLHLLAFVLPLLALSGCDDAAEVPADAPNASFLGDDGKADGAWTPCALANVLRLVNGPDLTVTRLTAGGVNPRAAKAIVASRAGLDEELGSEDDRGFADLQALDDVLGVGPVSMGQLADLGGALCPLDPTYEVLLNDPVCDVCEPDDKAWMRANSHVVQRIIALIEGAEATIDVAQFTFSVKEIEAALLAAHTSGKRVRLAINAAQRQGNTVATRLAAAGVEVKYVEGRWIEARGDRPGYFGLQHAKFLLVDDETLLTGSNNWSSTGTTINEENGIVVRSTANDPLLAGFRCHFDKMWAGTLDGAGACSVDGVVGFTPGSAAVGMIVAGLRAAETRVDVLMHHLVYDRLIKVLAQTAERGVAVRIVVNEADVAETYRGKWTRLRAAGAQIRFKRNNGDLYQLMHHKLAIVDGKVLFNGSGNWSGAFFNNYENYVRYTDAAVLRPFNGLFQKLWDWSLEEAALGTDLTPARQHAETHRAWFGNLHAHIHAQAGSWDDGKPHRHDENGDEIDVSTGDTVGDAARIAFEYGRDMGALDFLALTPHVAGDDPNYTGPNMRAEGYAELLAVAREVSESSAEFVALPGMEWSTNSTGNHVNIFGTAAVAATTRGDFAALYDGWLPERAAAGERPLMMFNHPRTFRVYQEALNGNWDQIFDVPLTDLPRAGERKKKFNDFGIDDYAPLSAVRDSWIAGEAMPDRAVVRETMKNVAAASAPYLRMMEVTVSRGTEFGGETPQNPSLSVDEDGNISRFTKVHTDWDHYLLNGFRVAPAANHDNHYANWGTGHTTRTAVLAPTLTEDTLLDAVDQRLLYATEAPALDLRFYALDRVPMGAATRTRGERVTAEFSFADPHYTGPYTVRLMRGRIGDDAVEAVQDFDAVAAGDWQPVAIDLPTTAAYFFYLEVHQLDVDRMAWSAPIWIERVE